MKSDKGESKPHHTSIPQKDAIAIVPPKKVSPLLFSLAHCERTDACILAPRIRESDNNPPQFSHTYKLAAHSLTTVHHTHRSSKRSPISRQKRPSARATSTSPPATSSTSSPAKTTPNGTKPATHYKTGLASCPSDSSRRSVNKQGIVRVRLVVLEVEDTDSSSRTIRGTRVIRG